MNKIRINAKSTPEYGEFLPKTNNGFHNIEIQLIHKYLKEQEYEDTKKGNRKWINEHISCTYTTS